VIARRLTSLCVGLSAALLAFSGAAAAQSVTLKVTGKPVRFSVPTVTDFDNGFIDAQGALTYTVQGKGGNKDFTPHTTIVSIRTDSPTLNGTVPVTTLAWRRGDLGTWNPLSTTNATVESRPFVRKTTNDPWSNMIFFRLGLSYADDTPGTYSVNLVFTLTATTP
jgi:hypothetical protein